MRYKLSSLFLFVAFAGFVFGAYRAGRQLGHADGFEQGFKTAFASADDEYMHLAAEVDIMHRKLIDIGPRFDLIRQLPDCAPATMYALRYPDDVQNFYLAFRDKWPEYRELVRERDGLRAVVDFLTSASFSAGRTGAVADVPEVTPRVATSPSSRMICECGNSPGKSQSNDRAGGNRRPRREQREKGDMMARVVKSEKDHVITVKCDQGGYIRLIPGCQPCLWIGDRGDSLNNDFFGTISGTATLRALAKALLFEVDAKRTRRRRRRQVMAKGRTKRQ